MIVISSSKYLYMGNKLVQYALFIALSEEYGIPIVNPSFAPYSTHFKTTSADFFCRYPAKRSAFASFVKLRAWFYWVIHHLGKIISERKISNRLVHGIDIDWDKECTIDALEVLAYAKNTNFLFMQGWNFKCKINIARHRNVIIRHLQPIDRYMNNVSRLIADSRKGADVLIGVHIRHGDYKTFMNGKYFYEAAQYQNLMQVVYSLLPDKKTRFLICSNSNQSRENFGSLDVCFGNNHAVEDMYAFAECDYIMGPPSTYTIWASFYGNKPLYVIENPNDTFNLEDFKVRINF